MMEQAEFREQPKSKATTAMVLGIVALVLSIIPLIGFVSWILAPLAIFFGLQSLRNKDTMPGRAITGAVTGGAAILVCLLWVAATVRETGRIAQGSAGSEQAGATGASADPATAATPSDGLARFVNTPANARTQELRERYVDFSFDYPASWEVTPQPPNSGRNFARVAAPLVRGAEPFAFHIGSATGTGNPAVDRVMAEQLVAEISPGYASLVNDYTITSTGPQRVGRYDSYGWMFTGNAEVEGERVQVFGRGDVIVPPGQTKGVTLITLATSRTDEVKSIEDLGEVGTLRALFDSFRIGPGA
jgi:hypothetical protein